MRYQVNKTIWYPGPARCSVGKGTDILGSISRTHTVEEEN